MFFPLFAETSDVATGAVIATILTAVIGAVGTYFANKQAAKTKADERDNDDKWKIIDQLRADQATTNQRFDASVAAEARCQAALARYEERVAFLEDYLESKGVPIPRKRTPGGEGTSTTHDALTDPQKKGGVK